MPLIAPNTSVHTKCTCSNNHKRYSIYNGLCTIQLTTTKSHLLNKQNIALCVYSSCAGWSLECITPFRTRGPRQDGSQEHCSSVPGRSKTEIESAFTYVHGADRLHSTIGRFDQDEAIMRSSSIDPVPVTRLDLAVPRSDSFIKCKGLDASRISADTLFR